MGVDSQVESIPNVKVTDDVNHHEKTAPFAPNNSVELIFEKECPEEHGDECSLHSCTQDGSVEVKVSSLKQPQRFENPADVAKTNDNCNQEEEDPKCASDMAVSSTRQEVLLQREESQGSGRKGQVNFLPHVKIVELPNDQEPSSMWYTSVEMILMQKEATKVDPRGDMANSCIEVDADVARRKEAIADVLLQQQLLWDDEVDDPDLIAEVYVDVIGTSQFEATQRGIRHAQHVAEFLRQYNYEVSAVDDENDEMKSVSSVSSSVSSSSNSLSEEGDSTDDSTIAGDPTYMATINAGINPESSKALLNEEYRMIRVQSDDLKALEMICQLIHAIRVHIKCGTKRFVVAVVRLILSIWRLGRAKKGRRKIEALVVS